MIPCADKSTLLASNIVQGLRVIIVMTIPDSRGKFGIAVLTKQTVVSIDSDCYIILEGIMHFHHIIRFPPVFPFNVNPTSYPSLLPRHHVPPQVPNDSSICLPFSLQPINLPLQFRYTFFLRFDHCPGHIPPLKNAPRMEHMPVADILHAFSPFGRKDHIVQLEGLEHFGCQFRILCRGNVLVANRCRCFGW